MDDMNNNNTNNPDNFEFEDLFRNNGENDYGSAEKDSTKGEENNQDSSVPVPPLGIQDEDEKIVQRNLRKKQQERNKKREEERKRRSMAITIIVFSVLLLIMLIVYFSLANLLPGRLMNQGKKYLNIKDFPKAYSMFSKASKARPYDEEPVSYQVIALSNMEPNYQTQQALYKIAESEDFEEASAKADSVLQEMKRQIDRKVGSNYAGNILYGDILFRWNTKQPVTYSIMNNNGSSSEYLNSIRQAFKMWSSASNGEIVFQELISDNNANIVVNVSDAFSPTNVDDISKSGSVSVDIQDDVLKQAQIYLKTRDFNGVKYNINNFKNIAEHEIGHALGLWGHSANPVDIMYYMGDYASNNINAKGLSQRDVNTLNLLYKMIPDSVNIPIDEKDCENMFYHSVITTYPGEDFDLETQKLMVSLNNNRQDIVKWVDLGIEYGVKKQYKRSNAIFNRALPYVYNDFNNQFVIYYNMAANFYKMRDYAMAEKYLKLATRINQDVDTQTLDAFIDFKMRKYDLAKAKLIVLNNKYPENIEIAIKLAKIYYSNDESEKAKDILDKVIRYNTDAIKDSRVIKYRKYNPTGSKTKK